MVFTSPPTELIFVIYPEIIVHKRPDFVYNRAQTIHKQSAQSEFDDSKLGLSYSYYRPSDRICFCDISGNNRAQTTELTFVHKRFKNDLLK